MAHRGERDPLARIAGVIQGLNSVLDAFGHLVRDIRATRGNDIPDCYKVLGVLPDAPMSVVKAAYRARMKEKGHPDLGGAEETAKLYNWAYEEICKERGEKK